LVKVGQNGTNICLNMKVKVGKIWSKFEIKMVKVMKSFAILTISKLWSCLRWNNCKPCLFWSKNIWSFAYVSSENFSRWQHFRETFLLLGQNFRKSWSKHDDTTPSPQCWCLHDVPGEMSASKSGCTCAKYQAFYVLARHVTHMLHHVT
jgi:hypothetical protein